MTKEKEKINVFEWRLINPFKKINWVITLLLINLITSCSIYLKEDQSHYKRDNIISNDIFS